jgi:HK97 family phage prohead protease
MKTTNPEIEIRDFDLVECRMEERGEKRALVGKPIVYNSESQLFGDWREVILPGAFDASIDDTSTDVYALNQHNTDQPLARRAKGTLRINKADDGIMVEFDLGSQTYAADLEKNVEDGNVEKMSFGFRVTKDNWSEPTEERPYYVREVIEAKLIEVSPVTFPAYTDTSLAKRSFEQFRKQSESNQPVTPPASDNKIRARAKNLVMRKKIRP